MPRTLNSAALMLPICTLVVAHAPVYAMPADTQVVIDAAQKLLPLGAKIAIVPDVFEHMRKLGGRPDIEDSFHTVNLEALVDRLRRWKAELPQVTPYYAVKTNHDPVIVATMGALGTGFDCASEREMLQVSQLGVLADRIIFAHPRKPSTSIAFAQQHGIRKMTFDSIEELEKMRRFAPDGQYVLRIKTADAHVGTSLDGKFGAPLKDALVIIDQAFGSTTPANVVGVSFHVGSNTKSPEIYRKALLDASKVFHYAQEKWHRKLSLLDLGGGWSGDDLVLFSRVAKLVASTIKAHFDQDVRVIAEPGRFFAAPTTSAAVRILGKSVAGPGSKWRFSYYLSDGVYGFYLTALLFHYDLRDIEEEGMHFKPLLGQDRGARVFPSRLWGATCDSYDKIADTVLLPEMKTGDFIYTDMVGAYNFSTQTNFNQITPSKAYYVYREPARQARPTTP